MKERCDATSPRCREREHMELVMRDRSENDQRNADNHREDRQRHHREFNETQDASEKKDAGGKAAATTTAAIVAATSTTVFSAFIVLRKPR